MKESFAAPLLRTEGLCMALSMQAGNVSQSIVDEARKIDAVIEAAVNECLAEGYRSSDMGRALTALLGEFWMETYVEPSEP